MSAATDATPALPVAYWKRTGEPGRGEPIYPDQIRTAMVESAGRRVLQEVVLDRTLERELTNNRITLADDAIAYEEALLMRQLDPDPDRSTRMIRMLRSREGLGPVRFAALLRRNASLRALVADQVVVSEAAITAAWDREHGPRRVARVLTVENLSDARDALKLIDDGEPFGEVAARLSSDPSRSTGGLIDPVSRLDPSWPTSFRNALWSLEPGAVSSPIMINDSYVLVRFGRELPGDGITLEDAREEANEIARTAQERLLMDETARRLLEETRVDVIERTLNEAWQAP